jgi:hypothetical protein
MEHQRYLPLDDLGKVKWLLSFAKVLPDYAGVLGLSDSVLDWVAADAAYFKFVMDLILPFDTYRAALTGYKNGLRDGTHTDIGDLPAPPVIGPHTIVAAGIFKRIGMLVQTIKAKPGYNDETIGKALGIIGAEVVVDFDHIKLKLKAVLKNEHAFLTWLHEHTQGADIWADYADGKGFVYVCRIFKTHFLDGHLPPPGESKIYRYKIRYVLNDELIGTESDIISITVTGH